MRFGSLFAGIGGLDLGLERAGMECVWQVEIDDYCQRVLARHFPDVARFRDVRDCHGIEACPVAYPDDNRQSSPLGQESLAWVRKTDSRSEPCCPSCLPCVDLICGGFPCQPVSHAGKRRGDKDERWLWPEFLRIIREVRPRWVLAENVPGLLSVDSGRLFGGILRDLAESGYDAEWNIVSAADVGAPHLRERVFIVAHANSDGAGERRDGDALRRDARTICQGGDSQSAEDTGTDADEGGHVPHALTLGRGRRADNEGAQGAGGDGPTASGVADANTGGRVGWPRVFGQGWRGEPTDGDWWSTECRLGIHPDGISPGLDCGGWECGIPRVVKGQRDRVNRLRALGNAVVPQVAEYVGRLIMAQEVLL